jgi:hypothetical protein
MRGHDHLIAMRKAGITPRIVFINDFPCKQSIDWHNPGEKYHEDWPADHVTICTDGYSLSSLDLRFVVGLTVSICSENEGRAKALFQKAKDFGAKAVAASHINSGIDPSWTEIYTKQEEKNA